MIHLISTQILLNRKFNCNLSNYNTNNRQKIKEKKRKMNCNNN